MLLDINTLTATLGAMSAQLNNSAGCLTPENHAKALREVLSPAAEIHLPGSAEFDAASTRWSVLEVPTVNIAVVPATEDDVVETVKYANEVESPILAFNGAHGAITTLGRMDRGIEIYLSRLSSVEVDQEHRSATIGGGASTKAVIDALWEVGRQAVTGTCECVGFLGPALGGGHGWLQGKYGLIADQFISLNVVTADGTLKTIDAASDLWWAMKGAGQNFGIVTSLTVKIYEIEQDDWAIETLIFAGDKVEAVYQAANKHFAEMPIDVINWSYWLNIPDVDPQKPVIIFYIIQGGTTVVDSTYTKPFYDIGPISIEPQSGTYRDLARWTNIATESSPCQKAGLANPRFPIYLEKYDVEAQKLAYEAFAAGVQGDSPFSTSIFMFEAYPVQGVRAVGSDSTAFAFRADNLLTAPLISYKPDGEDLDSQAAKLGNRLRDILHKGSGREELHAYINYAFGNESPQNWYGYEPWRQGRLKELKKKYDPKGVFSFFAPIE